MIVTGENRRTLRKTCTSATVSTQDPTWTNLGTNPGLHGEAGDQPPNPWHGSTMYIEMLVRN
jgi:hypothetical protein